MSSPPQDREQGPFWRGENAPVDQLRRVGVLDQPQLSLTELVDHDRHRLPGRDRLLSGTLSIGLHLLVLVSLFLAVPKPPKVEEPPAVMATLIDAPPTPEAVTTPTPQPPAPTEPPPPHNIARPVKAPPQEKPLLVAEPDVSVVEVSDSDLNGAATAENGPPGRACNMIRFLQTALRKDAMVQSAMAEAHRAAGSTGKALVVWDGDWMKSPNQEGKGIAAVREALLWEIAFAPESCRAEPVHGMALITLTDSPGGSRLVLGSGVWRWSDLLKLKKYHEN
jgi:hypothetical protein